MSIPKKIKIGSQTITIELVDPDDIDESYGRFTASKNRIQISKTLCKNQEALTLLHELLHACFWDAGLGTKFNKDDEEILVRALEGRVGALLKDNPKFLTYFLENINA